VTRDREARCWSPGEGVNFIYSSRVRFRRPRSSSRPGVNVTRDLSISLPIRVVVSPRTFRSRAARHGVYLSIYPSTPRYSHSSATPPPIWYMYTSEPNDLSLSLESFQVHACVALQVIAGNSFFFLRNTRMYIYIYILYENHVPVRAIFNDSEIYRFRKRSFFIPLKPTAPTSPCSRIIIIHIYVVHKYTVLVLCLS